MPLSRSSFLIPLVALFAFAGCSGPESTTQATAVVPAVVDFNFHVKPILSDRCFKCHGPDANTREAGLRLDTHEGALAALTDEDGQPTDQFAIVPGDPGASELVRRIHHEDPEERMPPEDSKLELTPTEIAILEKWIEQGAAWKEHWAFTPPACRPSPTFAGRTGRATPSTGSSSPASSAKASRLPRRPPAPSGSAGCRST